MKTNNKDYILYSPQNSWDMNYHLLDNKNKIEYLIDICDVTDNEDDEDGGLFIKKLLELKDINDILTYVWKEKPYMSEYHLNLLNGSKKTLDQLIITN